MKIAAQMPAAFARRWEMVVRVCADPSCRSNSPRLRWRDRGICLQGVWYCSSSCFESALGVAVGQIMGGRAKSEPVRHRIPLGLLLLSRGELSERQLQSALEAQGKGAAGRIGEWLEKLGFVSSEQVLAALGLQWACPVLSSSDLTSNCAHLLPYPLLEQFRMFPVRFVEARRALYVAFCADVHYPALYAIEEILRCRTEACLTTPLLLERALAKFHEGGSAADFVFDIRRSTEEVARIATSYALKLGAREVRMVGMGGALWLRLEGGPASADLLFTRQRKDREKATGYGRNPTKALPRGADREIVASQLASYGVKSDGMETDREILANRMVEHL